MITTIIIILLSITVVVLLFSLFRMYRVAHQYEKQLRTTNELVDAFMVFIRTKESEGLSEEFWNFFDCFTEKR